MGIEQTGRRYPRPIRRIEAVLLDILVVFALLFVLMNIIAPLSIHGGIKAAIIVSILSLQDPLLVSVTGASIGHHLRGLRVEHADTGENLGLLRAVLRYAVKALLGWYSVVFLYVTKRHQTVHDKVAGSVVIFKRPELIAEEDILGERVIEDAGYIYPSAIRRVTVIIIYGFLTMVIVGIGHSVALSESCLYSDYCDTTERLVQVTLTLTWMVGLAWILILGWRGRLWGARRMKRNS